ncbi:hypothetical protein DBR06_SOUSAS4610058, partial [Sousa chinensis]
MANRALACAYNVCLKIIVWSNGHGVQLECLEAYISKMLKTDNAVVVAQALLSWQMPNSKYVRDTDCSDGYTIVVPDIFIGQ